MPLRSAAEERRRGALAKNAAGEHRRAARPQMHASLNILFSLEVSGARESKHHIFFFSAQGGCDARASKYQHPLRLVREPQALLGRSSPCGPILRKPVSLRNKAFSFLGPRGASR